MFLLKAIRYLEELRNYYLDINHACKASIEEIDPNFDSLRIDKKLAACSTELVDCALIGSIGDAVVVPMDGGRSDIASWSSLWDTSENDGDGNATHGDVILHDYKNFCA